MSLLPPLQWEYFSMITFKMCVNTPGSEPCKARSYVGAPAAVGKVVLVRKTNWRT